MIWDLDSQYQLWWKTKGQRVVVGTYPSGFLTLSCSSCPDWPNSLDRVSLPHQPQQASGKPGHLILRAWC